MTVRRRYASVPLNNPKGGAEMCTRERALQLGQEHEVVEDAERRIAEYEKKHGKPMSKTGQAMWMLRGLVEVYDKTLLL